MAALESALFSRLSGDSTITDLLGDGVNGVWLVLAPQDSIKPYIVFDVVTEVPHNVMGVETPPTEARYAVKVVADSMLEIVNITNAVRASLNRLSGTVGGVVLQDTFYEGRSDLYDEVDRDYQRSLEYRCWYEE